MKVILLSLAILIPALPMQAGGAFFKYLVQSADRGEAESQFVLGLAHKDGWNGIITTGSATAKWCELAGEIGDERPGFVLTLLLKENDRVDKNEAMAIKLLGLAAEQGDCYAQVIFGDMLLEADGVVADWRAGTELIRKSAKVGFAPAQFRLGLIYMVGGETTPKDDVESLAWFIVAAEAGSKRAEEFREERTQKLGLEIARLAVKRSRTLFVKNAKGARSSAKLANTNN